MSQQRNSCLSPNVFHVGDPVKWRGKNARITAFTTQPDSVSIRLEHWVTDHSVSFGEIER